MRIRELHGWDVTPKEAIALQRKLAAKVRPSGRPSRVKLVAGADMAIDRHTGEGVAAVVLLTYPDLEEIERATARKRLSYPYIPGLLSFREAPVLIEAFTRLAGVPDVAIFDGQGIAHPRGLGLASHLGLWLGIPTIGCAKSRLVGRHAEPGVEAGSSAELKYAAGGGGEKTVGACLRTRRAVKPVYISPGHLIGIEATLKIVMRCTDGVRIPKPTRLADRIVGELAR